MVSNFNYGSFSLFIEIVLYVTAIIWSEHEYQLTVPKYMPFILLFVTQQYLPKCLYLI